MTTADDSVTTEKLHELWADQLRYAAATATDFAAQGATGDDGHDALTGALDLASMLEDLRFDDDLAAATTLIFGDDETGYPNLLLDISCDGICPSLWDYARLSER